MAAWMLYLTAVAGAFCLAGLLAEHGLRQLRRPVRWVWASAMAATVLLPLAVALADRGAVVARGAGAVASEPMELITEPAVWGRIPSHLGSSVIDSGLLWLWIAASLVMLGHLLLSAWTLRRGERSWRRATVAGHPVLVSANFGPAVVGALRPRIVLPSWVLEWDESRQRLIVMHEREHVRAGDSRLLLGGLGLLVLAPWCLPIWWQFYRLRLAMETDCDARLLATRAHAREYAKVLLAVAGRPTRHVLVASALAPTSTELERRIRLILAGRREKPGLGGVGFLAAGVIAILGLRGVPAPAALPNVSFVGALGTAGGPAPAAAGEALPDGVLPDGSLPGDPGEERLVTQILAHHAAALEAGLPSESIIWFVAGEDGEVKHTGIERGTEEAVAARIQARYPAETSEAFLGFEGVRAGSASVRVIWLIPAPAFFTDGG